MSEEKTTKEKIEYGDTLPVKLHLNTLKNSRNSLARLMRMYSKGNISHVQFRNLVYAFSHFIQFYKTDFENRIIALEQKADEKKN
jgi:hypothetical protein